MEQNPTFDLKFERFKTVNNEKKWKYLKTVKQRIQTKPLING